MAVAVTYDILDCGPRNRFVANGKLVHNSGGDKQNAQNLNRVDPRDPTSGALRMSWTAPKGHVIVVRDLGQIEARVLAYWAGQEDMLVDIDVTEPERAVGILEERRAQCASVQQELVSVSVQNGHYLLRKTSTSPLDERLLSKTPAKR